MFSVLTTHSLALQEMLYSVYVWYSVLQTESLQEKCCGKMCKFFLFLFFIISNICKPKSLAKMGYIFPYKTPQRHVLLVFQMEY